MPRTAAQMSEERRVCLTAQHVFFAIENQDRFPQGSIQLNLNRNEHRSRRNNDGRVWNEEVSVISAEIVDHLSEQRVSFARDHESVGNADRKRFDGQEHVFVATDSIFEMIDDSVE